MSRRRLLAATAIAIALTVALTGCSAGTAAEQTQAYEECRTKITPQFDDPGSVSWPDDDYTFSGSGDSREIVAVVDEGEARTLVSCRLASTGDGWELSSFDLGEPRDEVVN